MRKLLKKRTRIPRRKLLSRYSHVIISWMPLRNFSLMWKKTVSASDIWFSTVQAAASPIQLHGLLISWLAWKRPAIPWLTPCLWLRIVVYWINRFVILSNNLCRSRILSYGQNIPVICGKQFKTASESSLPRWRNSHTLWRKSVKIIKIIVLPLS